MVLIAAHLMALLFHRLKGERLVSAMITGRKAVDGRPEDEPAEGPKPGFRNDRGASLSLALVVLALSSLPVIWLWNA